MNMVMPAAPYTGAWFPKGESVFSSTTGMILRAKMMSRAASGTRSLPFMVDMGSRRWKRATRSSISAREGLTVCMGRSPWVSLLDAAEISGPHRLVLLGANVPARLQAAAVHVLDYDAVAAGGGCRARFLGAFLAVARELLRGGARLGPVEGGAA